MAAKSERLASAELGRANDNYTICSERRVALPR
jgi:hypothetical protein